MNRIKHKSLYVQDLMDVWHLFINKEITAERYQTLISKVNEKHKFELPLKVR